MPMINAAIPETSCSLQKMDLPDARSRWPEGAVSAYKDLLGELNAWCRDCGQSNSTNAWVAEAAIRQAW